ncbi:hypothetical protein [Fretibacter rubidus]|uniref:hypothetical protein n=1 Tax=Fretibacter rubidus TaxID=570162 RepID=UPI00352B84A2
MPSSSAISQSFTIIPVASRAQEKAFLDLPYRIYEGEPSWRAPLRFERKEQLSPHKNPVAATLTRQLFLAETGDRVVGRIAAFINPAHQVHHNDKAGHFGYFDCEADPAVGHALLTAAQNWLLSQGADRMVGPAQWSVNEECGLLIDGFDTPPVVMMSHGRVDYQDMVENFGMSKAVDMYAYQADLHAGYPRPRQTQMMVKIADKDPDITIRPMNTKDFLGDVNIVMDIFNDAWSQNWGFVPFSDEQITHMAKEIKPLMFKEGLWVGEIEGSPVAYIWMIPDLNEATAGLDGKLLPFGWWTLVNRLKIKGVKQARIPLMGLRREWHNTKKGLAIVAKLCETVFEAGRQKGFTHCELSWILEDNAGMIRICEQADAKRYKTYRMYEKAL